jgi:galactitol-specific phosphotransferase system IIB component
MSDDSFPFSDDDDVDTPDEGATVTPAEDNKTIKQMRDALERAEKRAKAYEKQVEKLSEFQTSVLAERKNQAVTQVFTEVGLSPKHAELFKKVNPDLEVDAITADTVKAFASEYELAASSGEVPDAPEVKPEGFTPFTTGNGSPVTMIDTAGILEKLKNGDFEGLTRDVEAGRVQKTQLPR